MSTTFVFHLGEIEPDSALDSLEAADIGQEFSLSVSEGRLIVCSQEGHSVDAIKNLVRKSLGEGVTFLRTEED